MNILLSKFWSKVEKTDSCWNWKGGVMSSGYGSFNLNKKSVLVHRYSYEILKHMIPKNLVIDHKCKNKLCVNPEHLEVVTQKENVLRGDSFMSTNAKKTHCPQGHEYLGENLKIYNNRRYCKRCLWSR